MPETPIETLERWADSGAEWRVAELSEGRAVVELRSCLGEPVDRLVSDDAALIRFLRERGGAAATGGLGA